MDWSELNLFIFYHGSETKISFLLFFLLECIIKIKIIIRRRRRRRRMWQWRNREREVTEKGQSWDSWGAREELRLLMWEKRIREYQTFTAANIKLLFGVIKLKPTLSIYTFPLTLFGAIKLKPTLSIYFSSYLIWGNQIKPNIFYFIFWNMIEKIKPYIKHILFLLISLFSFFTPPILPNLNCPILSYIPKN